MKKVLMICFMLAMIICIGGCNKNVGKLYTLEEAYDLNLITKDDLKNIAYYYNKLGYSEFVPKSKDPKSISKKNERLIKKTYLRDKLKEPRLSIKKVHIYEYYGTYNCYDYIIHEEYIIDGVSFYNFYVASISIYASNKK